MIPVHLYLLEDVNMELRRDANPFLDDHFIFAFAPEVIHHSAAKLFGKRITVYVLLFQKLLNIVAEATVVKNVTRSDFSCVGIMVICIPFHFSFHLR